MKVWSCDGCWKSIEVDDDYTPQYCCQGTMQDMCGCQGKAINPVFCDDCEIKLVSA